MSRRTSRIVVLAAAGAAALSVLAAAPAATAASRGGDLPPTELLGEGPPPVPLKDQAQIVVSEFGLRYMAGQQHSRLRITEVGDQLLYVDTGTKRWRQLPSTCVARSVPRGIAALCSIPPQFRDADTMFLEVWPRLGNDGVDGSTLSARYRMWVLADAGNDTVKTGAGDDFVNGAQNKDRVWGGAGDDWIRTGKGNDQAWGGDGDDKIVGGDADDVLYAGAGDDKVYGSAGNDRLWSDEGADLVVGGGGRDVAYTKAGDRVVQCETVNRRPRSH